MDRRGKFAPRLPKSASQRLTNEGLRPQKLCTHVVGISGACDRLTPRNLHVIGELATVDRDANRRDRSHWQSTVRFKQTPRDTAIEQAHMTFAGHDAQLVAHAGILP
jgi:hypothetical protein